MGQFKVEIKLYIKLGLCDQANFDVIKVRCPLAASLRQNKIIVQLDFKVGTKSRKQG